MFYDILAVLFLIKFFKKSINHARKFLVWFQELLQFYKRGRNLSQYCSYLRPGEAWAVVQKGWYPSLCAAVSEAPTFSCGNQSRLASRHVIREKVGSQEGIPQEFPSTFARDLPAMQ